MNSTSRCHFTKKQVSCGFLCLYAFLPSPKWKGKEHYQSYGQKSSRPMLQCLLISSPCKVTWKNKSYVHTVCRAEHVREPKPRFSFLLKKIRLWSGPESWWRWEMPIGAPTFSKCPLLQHRLGKCVCCPARGNPMSWLALQHTASLLFVLTTLLSVKWLSP